MTGETKSVETRGGIGFAGLLAVLFIGLKLTGYISWSWLWVLAPLWLPIALILPFLVLFGIFWVVIAILDKKKRDRWG